MKKVFKSEIYKLFCSKTIYISIILIFIYSILVNIIYLIDKIDVILLYQNFNDEFLLLYLVLIIYFASAIITDEFVYNTIIDLQDKSIILTKIIICLLYLIFLFLFSLIICYDVSLLIFKNVFISFEIVSNLIKNFLYLLPYLSIIILITLNIALVIKKANLTIIFTYLIYFGSEYLNSFVLSHHLTKFYYLLSINFNYNRNYLIKDIVPLSYSIILNIIIILLLLILTNFIFKHLKK